jgi:D-3-phosphoglycerate dehydrogenase
MKKIKLHVSCLTPVAEEALALVKNDKYELSFQDHLAKDDDELAATIADVDAVYLGGDDYYSGDVLRRAKNLKLMSFGGTGFETFIDAKAAENLGITITNTPGANSQSVAEFAVGLLLDALRKITFTNDHHEKPVTRDLSSLRIGLIGYGKINQYVHRIMRDGFGADVVFWNKTTIAGGGRLDEVLSDSDVIVIAITANDTTNGFLNAEKISKMKDGVIIINPARPSLFDEASLVDALKSGKVSAVAMDGEVDMNSPLRDFTSDKIIITPHIAARTKDAWCKMDMMAFKNIVNFFEKGE